MASIIRGLEKSLADASGALENLQLRHQAETSEYDRAVRERREVLIGGADQKIIDRAGARVDGIAQRLKGIEDAIRAQGERVATLTAELTATRDLAAREGRAKEIEDHISAVETALAGIEGPIAVAIGALNAAAAAPCPEATQAALLLLDTANQITRQAPRLKQILAGAARQALEPPLAPPAPATRPAPPAIERQGVGFEATLANPFPAGPARAPHRYGVDR
jgi:hypothetical protein